MPTLDLESALDEARATAVQVSEDELTVTFEDGRVLQVPLAWYPRLQYGTKADRQNYVIGSMGIHWPDLDEDLSYRGLLLGRKSGEGSPSLKFWLDNYRKGKKVTIEDFIKAERKKSGKACGSGRAKRN